MTYPDNKTLIIFTEEYPYGIVVESFLNLEILYLSSIFEKIVIVPTVASKTLERTDRILPDNVVIDTTYLQKHNGHHIRNKVLRISTLFFSVMKTRYFYREIKKNFPSIFKRSAVVSLRDHLYNASQIEKWTLGYIKISNVDLTTTLFYTYWLSSMTTGIALAKKKYPKIKLISRAHGWDLYFERHDPPFIPCRPEIFKYLDKVFLVSKDGKEYLSKKFPCFTDKFEIALLGVNDPGFVTQISQDNIYRIVSCSYLVPVKRIGLLIEGLKELGERKINYQFNWVHIGGGLLKKDLEDLAEKILPKNVTYRFLGFLSNAGVLDYYKDNPVDVFINVSESEGIPVTIMEAQSCGIPVIATAVGGNNEIISDGVGILIGANPSPQEIADAIINFLGNQKLIDERKKNSRFNWKKNYNAEQNYANFARQLKELQYVET